MGLCLFMFNLTRSKRNTRYKCSEIYFFSPLVHPSGGQKFGLSARLRVSRQPPPLLEGV